MSNTEDTDISMLSDEEREILALWMKQERQQKLLAQQIKPRQPTDNPPLSFAQERLWILDQLEPGSSAYNVPGAIKLKGKLDIEALRGSLQEIINRHEILRTAITMQNGEAVQDIKDTFELELEVEDLSAVAEPERSVMLKRRLSEDALQPFNLTTGPMIRCRLLRLGEDEHILMFAMHHIVSDGWSFAVLFRELGALYAAFCRGRSSPLSELPIQYADFAAWQRQWLNGEVLQAQLDYWTNQLKGVSNLQLPTDRPRPAIQTYSGAHASLILDKELTEQLEKINKQHNATPFMTLLSAFSILLKRYCGQDEIVVGTPIANRKHRETEDLLGFFVNTLVMRTDVSGNPTFGELLNRVKQIALGAYQHQDLPFETLVNELQPERDLSRNPLFQVLFVLQNVPSQSLSLEGLTLEGMPIEAEVIRFDLEVHIRQKGENLRLVIGYNTDLFDADTIERMLGHYQTILAQVAANPACRIEDLKLLNETEYQQVVVEWNRTDLAFPTQVQTVLELFEAQVECASEAIALEFAGLSLSYRELNVRANRIAHYLQEQGVGSNDVVGVCLPRGLEAAVTVLAALKAGCGYMPLDPSYPEDRLGYMVQSSQARVLITQTYLARKLPIGETLTICLDDFESWTGYREQNPVHEIREEHTAYVIFTSGSTGRPKGIVMPHRVLCNLIQWQLQRWGQLASSRTLQFSAFSFDISVQELFSTLCAGGTLVIIDEELRRDPERLLNFMHETRIGRIFIPYAALNQLAEVALSSRRVPGYLREVITAGEALQVTPALEYLFEQLEDCILDNQYGPAETHVVTANCLTGNAREWPRLPAIGRPIANAKIFLLDEQLSPVAVGVPGEMYIGGDCLAHGYIGQQELTEERFIRSPFSDAADARLYRTGDLARYGANGSIEFIGRIDNQVKIRGFRIELGEIEVVLSQNDNIRDCAVLIYEDRQGNKNIAAYFVSDSSFSTLSLRNFLRKKLPQYMIPTLLTKLDEIPVTPNGKTDYKTLASYTQEKTIRDSVYLPPETPAEKKIAGIWETLLNVDRIGVGDNFFDIGGHSLLLIQAKFVIEKELGVSVPIMDFFYQTLGQIATYCEKNQPPEMSREEI